MVRRLSQTKIRKKNKKLTVARKNMSSRRLSKKRSNKGRKQKGGRKTRRRSFKKNISQIGGAGDGDLILQYEKYLEQNKNSYYKFVIYDSNGNKYYIFLPNENSYNEYPIVIKLTGSLSEKVSQFKFVNFKKKETPLSISTGPSDEQDFTKARYLSHINTSYGQYKPNDTFYNQENYLKNIGFLVTDFLSFISNNRNKGNQNYPMTFHFKFTDLKKRDYGVKNPVPWCSDLISFVAKALNTPNTPNKPNKPNIQAPDELYAEVEDAVVQKPLLPFGINEQYVNYKFTFLEKTRCALHITKDTVSEILEKSNKKQENLYSIPSDAVSRPLPPPPKGPP